MEISNAHGLRVKGQNRAENDMHTRACQTKHKICISREQEKYKPMKTEAHQQDMPTTKNDKRARTLEFE